MSTNNLFAELQPQIGDVSNVSVINPRNAGATTTGLHRPPFETCPNMRPVIKGAARKLGTNEYVWLILDPSGPAVAVEREILKGTYPAAHIKMPVPESDFVISAANAIRLLRAHCNTGGRFVADHMQSRAHHHEWWTMTVQTDFVDARAYRGETPTFYVGSDFPGLEQYAEDLEQYAEAQPEAGDDYVHCGHKVGDSSHCWHTPGGPFTFVRPDGSVGFAKWIVCCDACFHRAKGNSEALEIKGDAVWRKDGPLFGKAENPYESTSANSTTT